MLYDIVTLTMTLHYFVRAWLLRPVARYPRASARRFIDWVVYYAFYELVEKSTEEMGNFLFLEYLFWIFWCDCPDVRIINSGLGFFSFLSLLF